MLGVAIQQGEQYGTGLLSEILKFGVVQLSHTPNPLRPGAGGDVPGQLHEHVERIAPAEAV